MISPVENIYTDTYVHKQGQRREISNRCLHLLSLMIQQSHQFLEIRIGPYSFENSNRPHGEWFLTFVCMFVSIALYPRQNNHGRNGNQCHN